MNCAGGTRAPFINVTMSMRSFIGTSVTSETAATASGMATSASRSSLSRACAVVGINAAANKAAASVLRMVVPPVEKVIRKSRAAALLHAVEDPQQVLVGPDQEERVTGLERLVHRGR